MDAEDTPLVDGITYKADPETGKWQIMGLDPSPELVAIAMGEPPPVLH